jgi:L-asparaginase
MRPIHIIVTGGTFDKKYNQNTGLMEHSVSCVEDIITRVKCGISYNISTLFLKDSLDITNEERSYIEDLCWRVQEEAIIVVHGTDTMIHTATRLASIPHKTIICVGAFIPHSVVGSDAEFNLGAAIAYTQSLPHGSYVSMNGIAFPYNHVIKNYDNQTFTYC